MAKKKVLVLRTCRADMSSSFGFVWPESGYVEAPDWKPTNKCGNGLHGWLWGEGDGSLGNWEHDANWLVVKVDADKIIDLNGKVKFPSGEVVFCGSRLDATNYLLKKAPGKAVTGAEVEVGNHGVAVVGYKGVAVAGNYGTAKAGNFGVATAGDGGVAIVYGQGVARAGNHGMAIVRNYGRATAGKFGRAIAGYGGKVQVGAGGTAEVGAAGVARAGANGRMYFRYNDYSEDTPSTAVLHVGEDGILPDTWYSLSGGVAIEIQMEAF